MKKVLVTISIIILVNTNALANSQFSFTCPDQFIGSVTSVNDVQSNGFQKIEVNFQVVQSLKGESFETKKIQVIKGGLVDFKKGQSYKVETRENWLCNASELKNSIKY